MEGEKLVAVFREMMSSWLMEWCRHLVKQDGVKQETVDVACDIVTVQCANLDQMAIKDLIALFWLAKSKTEAKNVEDMLTKLRE